MRDSIVVLTGGTGSFGQGFVRLLLQQPDVKMVRIFSRNEHSQRAMLSWCPPDRVSFYIGDIRDRDRLRRAMDGAHVVVHAAALKQAPLGEVEGGEFIRTNVIGSENVIEAARDCHLEKALLISSDKAVEPLNLYGGTKMLAEKLFLQADRMRGTFPTRFACTRYGNVAGTAGSVIPMFLGLKPGEPTPITDPECTRFWISLEDANNFVLWAVRNMRGGEVFIPRSPAVRLADLATAIRPGEPIKIIGLRAGEKKHEVLNIEGERYSSESSRSLTIPEIRTAVFGKDEAPSQAVGERCVVAPDPADAGRQPDPIQAA